MTKSEENSNFGYISAIYGSLIEIKGIENQVRLHDMIQIVDHKINGEEKQDGVSHPQGRPEREKRPERVPMSRWRAKAYGLVRI